MITNMLKMICVDTKVKIRCKPKNTTNFNAFVFFQTHSYFVRSIFILWQAFVQRCSVKKDVLKNFEKFIGKQLCHSLFFDKAVIFGFCGEWNLWKRSIKRQLLFYIFRLHFDEESLRLVKLWNSFLNTFSMFVIPNI